MIYNSVAPKHVTVPQAIIMAMKMYDQKDDCLIRCLINGFVLRHDLNFIYNMGLTPKDLEDKLAEMNAEPIVEPVERTEEAAESK